MTGSLNFLFFCFFAFSRFHPRVLFHPEWWLCNHVIEEYCKFSQLFAWDLNSICSLTIIWFFFCNISIFKSCTIFVLSLSPFFLWLSLLEWTFKLAKFYFCFSFFLSYKCEEEFKELRNNIFYMTFFVCHLSNLLTIFVKRW